MKKKQSGITLIALVITIIILLILAGISISALTNTGLFEKAEEAKQKTENAQAEENVTLNEYEDAINGYLTGGSTGSESTTIIATISEVQSDDMLTKTENTTAEDEYGNKITIPAGFKVTTEATTVNKGIVVEDSDGNQFVWIPVGTIYTNVEKTKSRTIELNRYTFEEDGTPNAQNDEVVNTYFQELATSTYGNTTAKDIESFKTSATTNRGYYIGRYEARTETIRSSGSDTITTLTENGSQYVYNYVTQLQAAELSREMYSSSKFTSDLMNSYAWDTATLFLQEFGDNSTYSRQANAIPFVATGTNNEDTQDVQCNVYDMAGNNWEWTTETSSFIMNPFPCVHRGGGRYGSSSQYYTNARNYEYNYSASDGVSFRPILYVK